MQSTCGRKTVLWRLVPLLCLLAVWTAACGGNRSVVPEAASATGDGSGILAPTPAASVEEPGMPATGAPSGEAHDAPLPSETPAGLPAGLVPDDTAVFELPVAAMDNRFRKVDEAYIRDGVSWRESVELGRITPELWMHVTYTEQADRLSASNGLVAFQDHGALLVNTPGNAEQTYRLLDLVKSRFGVDVAAAVVTSAESACTGGVAVLQARGVPVLALQTVADLSPDKVREKLQVLTDPSARVLYDRLDIVLLQPERDSGMSDSLLWLPQVHALYARSLLLSEGEQLPRTASPDLLWSWRDFLTRWMVTYDETDIFIPGSGEWGTRAMLDQLIGRITERLPANVTGSAIELFVP